MTRKPENSFKKFMRHNALTIVLLSIFLSTLVGMSITGWKTAQQESANHHSSSEGYIAYIRSGDFIEGVFENWESEFLQMWALVVLTVMLKQKGADESKPLKGKMKQETSPRYQLRRAKTWSKRFRAIGHLVYSHSLSAALLLIFLFSFTMHAIGGAAMQNEDARRHGETEIVSPLSYIATSNFWYESLQNWQSEFLAVASLMILSVKLRERGSPESKPVGRSYDTVTGG
jgi:hypothetical protein